MDAASVRHRLLHLLGSFPDHIPLDPVVGPSIDETDYVRTRVTYMVEPGERVAAWLLTPRAAPPLGDWPAVLAIHQHADQYDVGKAEPAGLAGGSDYAYGRELCQRGYIVLCPDLLCFEERQPADEVRRANRVLDGASNERFEFTKRLLTGSCLQTKYLHDLTCALDLLANLPAVNRDRLGVIGHSLGGLEALWLAWYDPRVAVAVSSCGFGLLRTLIRDGINHGFAMYVPGMLSFCDLDALLSALAPRPFLLTAGEADSLFPMDGVRSLVATTQRRYAETGTPERFQAILFPSGHSFPAEVREEAYCFLDRWLR
jgi:dienelactone hydrolase